MTLADAAAAERWAARLDARLVSAAPGAAPGTAPGAAGPPPGANVLEVGAAGLTLVTAAGRRISAAAGRLAGGALPGRDLLARAALTNRQGGPPTVVDATAGLGADGFHLAALGHAVTMLEREPLFAALLEDALARARGGALGVAARAAAERVSLVLVDARAHLPAARGAEVVYLDPMFPATGGTALPPKEMAALRAVLVAPAAVAAGEGAELLRAARAAATRRVVVKRALRAPPLGEVAPSGSLTGRTVRYDLYAPAPA